MPAATGVFDIVVADQADVGDRQRRDQLEVVLVPFSGAGPGKVTEIGEEDGRGAQLGGLAQQLGEDGIGGGVRPRAAVAGDHERERVLDGRGADAIGHAHVARSVVVHPAHPRRWADAGPRLPSSPAAR